MKKRTATFHITAVLGRSTRDAYALRLTLPRVCTRQRSALLPLVILSRSRLYIHFQRYRCTGCAFSLSVSHRKVEARSRGSNALTRVHRCMHTFFSRMHIRLSACLFFLSLSPSLFLFSHALRCTSYLSLSLLTPFNQLALSGVCQQWGEEHERKNGTILEERGRYLHLQKHDFFYDDKLCRKPVYHYNYSCSYDAYFTNLCAKPPPLLLILSLGL